MAIINFDHHPQFFTATILEWKTLLKEDAFKDIIIKSLHFLSSEKSIVVYGFVIMPNHIHLIWQIQDGYKQDLIQMRFLKFTAQQMKFRLIDTNDDRLSLFISNSKDREYQFWERNALSIDLWNPEVFMQKLDYIHNNPLQINGGWQNSLRNIDIHQRGFMKPDLMNLVLLNITAAIDLNVYLLVTTPTKAKAQQS